ncbi:hypothetical protein LCGC14_1171520 [marine sediment metagenome]|uniref:Uncharacterized protein n=1 Tax=marine sediment metagenome TaxID=412755 RepID=A0A0F9MCM9_9ZZZZ
MDINFDYCNKEEWIAYINDIIMPVMRVSSYLLSFNYYLKDFQTGTPISEVLKNDTLKEKLFGGLSENGESLHRSLAEFYNRFFGWALADASNYLLHQSENININIYTTKRDTNFIYFLQEVQVFCQEIFDSAFEIGLIENPQFKLDMKGENLFISDEALIKEISLLYELLAKFVINYNEKTLFIWTLRQNTKRYLLFQYEKLREPDCFDLIKTLMGLFPSHIILLEEKLSETSEKLQDKYTVWELKDQFGSKIIGLNDLIFDSFEEREIKKYFDFMITDLEDFKKSHQEKMKRLKPIWEIPEEFKIVKRDEAGNGTWYYQYRINGVFFTEYQKEPSQKSRYNTRVGKCHLSFLDFLDTLSPALFVGAIELIFNNNWCQYKTIIN